VPSLMTGGDVRKLTVMWRHKLRGDQSAVRFSFEANDWVHGKPAEVSWAELGGTQLQHLVSTAENVVRCYSIAGLIGPRYWQRHRG
jgi:hypothetical protein